MSDARILVADDDPAIRAAVSWLLKEQGYDVVAATREGLCAQLEQRPADLLLLDVDVPEEDGTAVLRKLRANDRWRDLPVLMVSATGTAVKLA